MNLILLSEKDRTDGSIFCIRDRRAEHVRTVLGLSEGADLRVGFLDGPAGRGRIVRSDTEVVELRCSFESEPMPRPPVDLVLAICRPKALKRILRDVAMLGVDRLTLIRTWRVERAYLESPVLTPEVYEPVLIDGLMQAGHTALPRVSVHTRFVPFIEDVAPSSFASADVKLVAHPSAPKPLATVRVGTTDRVVVAIGPERGFIDTEIERFEGLGFVPVHGLDRTLRVETACTALLAQLQLLRDLV